MRVERCAWGALWWDLGVWMCDSNNNNIWLKHQYLKHKYQSMVQQIIANMLSETVYTGITNLYIITKNQQNTKQYIINVNSVF